MTKKWYSSEDWLAYLLWLGVAWAIGLGSLVINVLRGR